MAPQSWGWDGVLTQADLGGTSEAMCNLEVGVGAPVRPKSSKVT